MAVVEEHFSLTFNGPALDDHVMSVEQLAPALLALGQAFQTAQTVVAPNQPKASLNIKVTREGSFAVDLLVQVPGLLEHTMDVLMSRPAESVLNAAGLVGIVTSSITLIKWLHGKKSLRQETLADGEIRITDGSGNSIVVSEATLNVVRNSAYRRDIEKLTRPLEENGIESIAIDSRSAHARAEKKDRHAYQMPEASDREITASEREVALQIENVAFQEGNKWRVSDGERSFYAAVTDLGFISRVENGEEQFAATDTLRVKLLTRQYRTAKGQLKVEHEITKVLQHDLGARQIPLPFEEPPAGEASGYAVIDDELAQTEAPRFLGDDPEHEKDHHGWVAEARDVRDDDER